MKCSFILLTTVLTLASSASIFDLLSWNSDDQDRQRNEGETSPATCGCNGSTCTCCVDFNVTYYIDLKGPVCVDLKYISQAEGVLVNISYGTFSSAPILSHSIQLKGPNPEPACFSIFDVFHFCAQFAKFEPHDEGLRGCVVLEAKLFSDILDRYKVGCFIMGPKGMEMEKENNSSNLIDIGNTFVNSTQTEEINEEELMATLTSETVKKGLAFFDHLLGFAFDATETKKENETEQNQSPT